MVVKLLRRNQTTARSIDMRFYSTILKLEIVHINKVNLDHDPRNGISLLAKKSRMHKQSVHETGRTLGYVRGSGWGSRVAGGIGIWLMCEGGASVIF